MSLFVLFVLLMFGCSAPEHRVHAHNPSALKVNKTPRVVPTAAPKASQ